MNERVVWGVDIGGTTAVIGRLEEGEFSRKEVIPTGLDNSSADVLTKVSEVILARDPEPAAVGVGIAGLVDHVRGLLHSSPNLPGWHNCFIAEIMESAIGAPVYVDNDCNVVARGGLATGEIPSDGLYLVVTLGTGIGGTIVLDGDIAYGAGHAGEFGHMTVEADGIACPCGSTGCWEVYAARDALMRYYSDVGGVMPSDPRSVAEMARKDDLPARTAFELFGKWAGIGFANLGMCFDPIRIYLAGGLSCNYPLFGDPARAEFGRRCSHDYMVSAVDSSEEAGARGAAHMATALFE